MYNQTIVKFGFPETLLREFRHWVVLLRPEQVTLGSLVLAAKSEATSLGETGAEALSELAQVCAELEATLKQCFGYDRINYLLLMMVDRQVHFHVLPRYAQSREFMGETFVDHQWPNPPLLTDPITMTAEHREALGALLREGWRNTSTSGRGTLPT